MKPLLRIWPFFASLLVSGLILVGVIARSEPAVSDEQATVTAPVTVQTPKVLTQQTIDVSQPWNYTFDERKSRSLDVSIWTIENGNQTADYNQELQTYTNRRQNVRVEGDSLVIHARAEELNGKRYTSARINTKESFAFTYGTLEVEMKLPRGVGTWPAAWLMPQKDIYKAKDYGVSGTQYEWALNGEIDFLEAVGYIPGEVIPSVHNYNSLQGRTLYTPGYVKDPYTTYHRYGVIKTPTSISFTIDGKVYATREKTSNSVYDWPYDQPYYLILNLAIGGSWGGEQGVDDMSANAWKLYVRSVNYKPL